MMIQNITPELKLKVLKTLKRKTDKNYQNLVQKDEQKLAEENLNNELLNL